MSDLRTVRFESPALGGARCEVRGLVGEDELNHLFSFAVELAMPDAALARRIPREILRSPATLTFEEDGAAVAAIHGIAAEVRHAESPGGDAAALSVTIVPRAWLLTRARRSEIFLGRTVPEILAERLAGAGLDPGSDFVLALRDRYPVREMVVQYEETDLAFFARLCEDQGIAFFFDHRDGRDVLVMTDTMDAFEPIARERPELRFGRRGDDRAAFEIARTLRRAPERALVHDDNHRAPRVALFAAVPTGLEAAWGPRVEHGAHVKTPEEAERLARVRAEEIGAAHTLVSGKSTEMALRAGATVVLVDDGGAEHRLLLTRVVHRSHLPGEGGGEQTLHTMFSAVPREIPWRPQRMTPWPKVPGLIHAVVDGALRGPYAELDEAGRYKVRFGYDLSGRGDLLASRPVRMLQPHAGARCGLHFPLRPGTEVMVACVEGDPDRPVIVGAVPDAETPSPVEQANQTQGVLRTAAANELVIEDLEGHERIRLHTPHAESTLQLGAREEPEEGALLSTQASITAVSGRSINALTEHSVLLCRAKAALAGESAVLLSGVGGLLSAAEGGMQRIGSVARRAGAVAASLEAMAVPPGEGSEAEEDTRAGSTGARRAPRAGGGRFSDLAAELAARARGAAMQAISVMARAVDAHVGRSRGHLEGEPLGPPGGPSAVVGGPATAALFGRDSALVFGDRAASLASQDTASVVGGTTAQLKSPSSVEVAGGGEAHITSPGVVEVQAGVVRIVGGYPPERRAKPLDDMTSVGVLARDDLRLTSDRECILMCGQKNVIITAHTGSLGLKAGRAATISAGSVAVSGGAITARAGADLALEAKGDVRVKAGGTVHVEGAAVEISGGSIVLKGPVQVAGDLRVSGTVNGKPL